MEESQLLSWGSYPSSSSRDIYIGIMCERGRGSNQHWQSKYQRKNPDCRRGGRFLLRPRVLEILVMPAGTKGGATITDDQNISEMSDDDRIPECDLCGKDQGLCDRPRLRNGRFFTIKLDETFDVFTCIPCHARWYVLEKISFQEVENMETRRDHLRSKHGFTFRVKLYNAVNQSHFGCSNWEALGTTYGFQEDMEITFDIRPEDDIEGNIDIWVDVDMLPVLTLSYFLSSSETRKIVDMTHYTYGSHLTWEDKDVLVTFVNGVMSAKDDMYNGAGSNYSLYMPLMHRLRADDIPTTILVLQQKLPNDGVLPLLHGKGNMAIKSRTRAHFVFPYSTG